jgi:transposase
MERMGLIPDFENLLIHDGLSAYATYVNCHHGPCNAHHQRELIFLYEELDQPWAGDLVGLLLEAKDLAKRECNREEGSRRVIGKGRLNQIIGRYHRILEEGYQVNPEPPPKPKGQKGRVKRGKALNLLDRLSRGWEQVLGFFLYPGLYPYDNNQAERDVRPMKVREKISGTFRSEAHGKHFCALRGVISSARKQKRPILEVLRNLVAAPTALGESLAQAV